jgi:hypothetical protein
VEDLDEGRRVGKKKERKRKPERAGGTKIGVN